MAGGTGKIQSELPGDKNLVNVQLSTSSASLIFKDMFWKNGTEYRGVFPFGDSTLCEVARAMFWVTNSKARKMSSLRVLERTDAHLFRC